MPRKQKQRSAPVDLTPELALELPLSHPGLWVAVSRGSLLEAEGTLNELLGKLGDRSATVLRVPNSEVETD